jgi:hypothetical protein
MRWIQLLLRRNKVGGEILVFTLFLQAVRFVCNTCLLIKTAEVLLAKVRHFSQWLGIAQFRTSDLGLGELQHCGEDADFNKHFAARPTIT